MKIHCDYCSAEMKFIERVPIKKKYRMRRFECPICGEKKTVFADGERDEVLIPKQFPETIEEVVDIEDISNDIDDFSLK